MKASIYARKSTDQNGVADDQRSVRRQIDHAQQYAARKGWTVDEASVLAPRPYRSTSISGGPFANTASSCTPRHGRNKRAAWR
jgi:DNA invertase Pin-like site-specific DNA recombinase